LGDVRFIFRSVQTHLEKCLGKEDFKQHEVAASMSQKLGVYWNIMDHSSVTSSILDP
jgi:hypothetical protein